MDYAHSTFYLKSLDEEQRIIEGYASTPEPDRMGDVMESAGAKFALPMPFLWQHQKDKPIGHVLSATPTSSGIRIKARIEKGVLPFIDEAWALIKSGLVRGLSIGWRPLSAPVLSKGVMRYASWEWLELSAVTIPANASATIHLVKTLDAQHLAASGSRSGVSSTPGVSGSQKTITMTTPVSEQIAALNAQIQQKSVRLEELMSQNDSEGGLDENGSVELDGLTPEINSLTKKLGQLSALEAAQAAQAKTLSFQAPGHTSQTVNRVSIPRVEVKELPKGTLFTRYAMAVAAGKGSISDTIAYAKRWDGQTPEVTRYIKAEVGTTTGASPGWGAELVPDRTLPGEFVELVRAQTILGKLNGFRMVPPRVNVQVQTGGSTFEWVGETGVKPVGQLDFTTVPIGDHKVAGIVVISEELIRSSSPNAEDMVRRDLVAQCARYIDLQFISPSVAAGASNPASITNGVTAPNASGTDADAVYKDLNGALATFDNANVGLENIYIITTPALARGIASLRNALGQFEFTGASIMGGTLMGLPLIVSSTVPAGYVILVKADEIFVADEGRVRLDASNQATLSMTGGATATFNLWQRNCVGIRAEHFITWAKRSAASVAVIDTASYGPT